MAGLRPRTESLQGSSRSTNLRRTPASIQPLSLTSRPGFLINQRVPTASDIGYWQDRIVKSKNFDSEFNPDHALQRPGQPRVFASPRIALRKVKSGQNLGSLWFPNEQRGTPHPTLLRAGTSRFGLTIRPDTYAAVFPTSTVDFHKMPSTTSNQWEIINLKKDRDLGNYGVNSSNAFHTHWLKHHTLKHRKFFNTDHPEYVHDGLEHHRKKDHIVNYRESMLGVKDMMTGTWKAKK